MCIFFDTNHMIIVFIYACNNNDFNLWCASIDILNTMCDKVKKRLALVIFDFLQLKITKNWRIATQIGYFGNSQNSENKVKTKQKLCSMPIICKRYKCAEQVVYITTHTYTYTENAPS